MGWEINNICRCIRHLGVRFSWQWVQWANIWGKIIYLKCPPEWDTSRMSLVQQDRSLNLPVQFVFPVAPQQLLQRLWLKLLLFFYPSAAFYYQFFFFFSPTFWICSLQNFVEPSQPPFSFFALFQSTPHTFQGADNRPFNICGCHLPPIKPITEYLIDHGYDQTGFILTLTGTSVSAKSNAEQSSSLPEERLQGETKRICSSLSRAYGLLIRLQLPERKTYVRIFLYIFFFQFTWKPWMACLPCYTASGGVFSSAFLELLHLEIPLCLLLLSWSSFNEHPWVYKKLETNAKISICV